MTAPAPLPVPDDHGTAGYSFCIAYDPWDLALAGYGSTPAEAWASAERRNREFSNNAAIVAALSRFRVAHLQVSGPGVLQLVQQFAENLRDGGPLVPVPVSAPWGKVHVVGPAGAAGDFAVESCEPVDTPTGRVTRRWSPFWCSRAEAEALAAALNAAAGHIG